MNFGSNGFIWILFLLLLMPNGFGCGNSCGGDNSYIFLIIILLMMQNGNCGICEAK